jgi:hypothetical protein
VPLAACAQLGKRVTCHTKARDMSRVSAFVIAARRLPERTLVPARAHPGARQSAPWCLPERTLVRAVPSQHFSTPLARRGAQAPPLRAGGVAFLPGCGQLGSQHFSSRVAGLTAGLLLPTSDLPLPVAGRGGQDLRVGRPLEARRAFLAQPRRQTSLPAAIPAPCPPRSSRFACHRQCKPHCDSDRGAPRVSLCFVMGCFLR